MGFFKKLFGDAADDFKNGHEESRDENVKESNEMNKYLVTSDSQVDENDEEPYSGQTPNSVENGLFSARLEAMIAAALQDGVLTDKEREILKRRVEKEGEDWDEVEMIIEARLAEMKSTTTNSEIEVPIETSIQHETGKTAQLDMQEKLEEKTIPEDETMDAKQLLPTIVKIMPKLDIEHLSWKAKNKAYDYIEELAETSSGFKLSIAIYKKCVREFMDSHDEEESKSKIKQLLDIKYENNVHPITDEAKVDSISYEAKVDPISYGGNYEDLMDWKAEKYKIAKQAVDHFAAAKSPENYDKAKKLAIEYEEIKKAINNGASTIDEVILAVQQSIGVRIKPSDSFVKSMKAKEAVRKQAEEKARLKAVKEIVIPEGVKEIRKGTYEEIEAQSVIFPSSLIKIEEGAFKDCYKLKNADFSRCTNLEIIDNNIFIGCEELQELDLGNCTKLESICDEAFYYQELKTIILPPSLKSIGNSAFQGKPFKEIDFSRCHQLEFIGDNAFSAIDAQSIDLSGTSVKHIGEDAFSYSLNLTSVVLPETLIEIGRDAFKACPLKEIVIPDSVEIIGSQAFADNEKLERATIGRSAKDYFYEKKYPYGPIFEKTPHLTELTFRAELAAYTGATNLTNVTFCDTVKEIGKWAVAECSELGEIVLPDSVTKIGYGAFAACENLSSIVLPDSITEIAESAFARTKLKEIVFPRELQKLEPLGEGLEKLRKLDFSKVTKLKVIPEDFISDDTPKLKEITIPIGVTKIEENIGGENLDRLFLPPTIKEIEDLCQVNIDIYCFSPKIEELEPIVEGIENKKDAIRLHVLPEYVESYKGQRDAEGISSKILVIDVMPEEFRYYYDN